MHTFICWVWWVLTVVVTWITTIQVPVTQDNCLLPPFPANPSLPRYPLSASKTNELCMYSVILKTKILKTIEGCKMHSLSSLNSTFPKAVLLVSGGPSEGFMKIPFKTPHRFYYPHWVFLGPSPFNYVSCLSSYTSSYTSSYRTFRSTSFLFTVL